MKINTPYITLGQLLKFAGIAMSGGDIKYLLNETDITVNKEVERRRGRKLYPGDIIIVGEQEIVVENDK